MNKEISFALLIVGTILVYAGMTGNYHEAVIFMMGIGYGWIVKTIIEAKRTINNHERKKLNGGSIAKSR